MNGPDNAHRSWCWRCGEDIASAKPCGCDDPKPVVATGEGGPIEKRVRRYAVLRRAGVPAWLARRQTAESETEAPN